MKELVPILGIVAGVISLAAYPPYIRDMVKGTTKPQRASWFIWSVLSGIALGSQIASGGTWSLLMTAAQAVGVIAVFLLSLKYGHGGLRRWDIVSLIVAGAGLLAWALTDKPLLALVLVVMVDAAGAWLTIHKAYKDPASETLSTWWLDSASNLLGVLAVGSFNLALILYPAYLLAANFAVVVAIYLARSKMRTS